jgi:quinol monooxygenase YgiN
MVFVAAQHGIEVVARSTPAHRRELLQTMEEIRDVRADAHVEALFELLEDTVLPNRFVWLEWWGDLEKARTAMGSDSFRTLLAAINVLGTLESVRFVESTDSADHDRKPPIGWGRANDPPAKE